jgi:hypothetical protein|nr:MAG TPA: Recombination enhancement, RecA-dependent nuclease [Caudoviricetes sp.]
MAFPKPKRKKKKKGHQRASGRPKKLWSIFTEDMDHCMHTGAYGVERHHVFSHTSKEIELSEDYGFIAPLRPDLHPNGTRAGKNASKVDRYLRKRCKEYYLQHYGTEEQFRQEFHYVSKG